MNLGSDRGNFEFKIYGGRLDFRKHDLICIKQANHAIIINFP